MTPATAVATFEPKSSALVPEESPEDRIARLTREFGRRIVALMSTATITVTDKASCESAIALRSTIGQIKTEIEASFKPEKDYYFRKHHDVCAKEHELLDQLIDPRNSRNPNTIDGKLCLTIQAWTSAEDARRREEEQQLAVQARKDADARAALEAAAAETSGQHEMATAILEEAIAAPSPVVVLPNIRSMVTGLKTKRVWRWRFSGGPKPVKDILKETPPEILAKAMAIMPRDYLTFGVKRITDVVEAMHDATKIPGVQVYYEDVPIR